MDSLSKWVNTPQEYVPNAEYEAIFLPATQWHLIGEGISWRPRRHWMTGCYAGEGRTELSKETGDKSGCLHTIYGTEWTTRPLVVEARLYTHFEKRLALSALLSYPNGLSLIDHYFWECYPIHDDVMRFNDEQEMEEFIKVMWREK